MNIERSRIASASSLFSVGTLTRPSNENLELPLIVFLSALSTFSDMRFSSSVLLPEIKESCLCPLET